MVTFRAGYKGENMIDVAEFLDPMGRYLREKIAKMLYDRMEWTGKPEERALADWYTAENVIRRHDPKWVSACVQNYLHHIAIHELRLSGPEQNQFLYGTLSAEREEDILRAARQKLSPGDLDYRLGATIWRDQRFLRRSDFASEHYGRPREHIVIED